jgi:Sugar (and other) transporter
MLGECYAILTLSLCHRLKIGTGAETFPTASRGTGYSLTDGLGHLGGVVGISILIPLTAYVGAKYAFPILGIPVIIAGLIVIALIPRTVGKRLEEVNETFVGTGKPVPTARSLSESDTQGTRPS